MYRTSPRVPHARSFLTSFAASACRSRSLGASKATVKTILMVWSFFVGVVLRNVLLGVLLFALGAILFAVRGYLNTGDKAVAGALIFVALVAIGIETVIYLLGPKQPCDSR